MSVVDFPPFCRGLMCHTTVHDPMPLTLLVHTYRHQPVSGAVPFPVAEAGASLGRSPECDLVLDDPGKFISRIHATVSVRGGEYFLKNTGSNPSIVNDRPLTKGKEILLVDGDCIVIGDYQLDVRFEAIPIKQALVAAVPINNVDLPLFEPPVPVKPLPLPPFENTSAAVDLQTYQAPLVDALAGARILAVGKDSGTADLLNDPLGLNLFGAASPLSGDAGFDLSPQFRAAESDHVPPELLPFQMPGLDNILPSPLPLPLPLATPLPTPGNRFVIPDDYDPFADFLPLSVAPADKPASTPDLSVAVVAASLPAPTAPSSSLVHSEILADKLAPTATPTLVVAPAEAIPSVAGSDSAAINAGDSEILKALLRGLGLPDLKLNCSGVQVAETVGAMLREATAGTIDILMARTLTKKESRIDMTMIAVNANNPLKFFPNPDSALTQMLTSAMAGYMPPVQAMQSAFSDLKAHELAVIAGMRAALAAVLHRFDPARIEAGLAVPGVMDKMMASHRKARSWDRLVELYSEIARDADDDFQRLFGEEFSQAYAKQVERLQPEKK